MFFMKIELPIYHQVTHYKKILVGLNWYRNANHFESNAVKNYYHNYISMLLLKEKQLFTKIHVTYTIYAKTTNTDGPNVRSVIEKFFLDALKECGNIKDDNVKIVVSDSSSYFIDKYNPRAIIEVSQV